PRAPQPSLGLSVRADVLAVGEAVDGHAVLGARHCGRVGVVAALPAALDQAAHAAAAHAPDGAVGAVGRAFAIAGPALALEVALEQLDRVVVGWLLAEGAVDHQPAGGDPAA